VKPHVVVLGVLSLLIGVSASHAEAQGRPAKIKEKPLAEEDRAIFRAVPEDPGLPRVLLIGDSISIGYTVPTRDLLKGKANLQRIPANGGPTSRGVESLSEWLGTGKWDVIHFNWGLHDIKRLKEGKKDVAGEWQVSAEPYEKNLDALVQQLKATGASLIWASTTPVPDGAAGRIKGEEVQANAIADKVMKKYSVPTNDLYGYVLPRLAEFQRPQNVHFTPEGYEFLAKQVAAKIVEAIDAKATDRL